MDLGTALACSVARQPDATAMVDGEVRLTYGAWYDRVRAVAGGLKELGLKRGDHLVTATANSADMATLYWACQMLGLIFTPFNWRATTAEIEYVLNDAEARAFAVDPRTAPVNANAPVITLCGAAGGTSIEQLARANPVAGPAGPADREIALMLYTSGTTGRPKGVPRSHAAERIAALSCIAQLYYKPGESQLGVMPLFHTMGQRSLLMAMMLNGSFVCMQQFDGEAALALIAREKISALFLVPTMFHDLVHHPRFADYDTASVRNLGYAGMSMTTALTGTCAAKFKPETFVNFYGSSEIYTFAVCDHLDRKPGCAGRAGLNQEIRVVRADPEPTVGPGDLVQPGEAGEIIASMRSAEAFSGYWKRPDADRKNIRQGWYFTGDLGYWDGDGELFIVGRVDDMIISGGENIYPEEVEDVLARSGLVKLAAVVGMPDERWGQKVVAFVEPASRDVTAEKLDQVCLASALARFKRPRAYVFVDAVPRSASGKLLRRFLRDGQYKTLPDFISTL
jgi:2-furoate---CoA ligase